MAQRKQICCLGAGPIGISFAQLFCRHGFDVELIDPDANACAAAEKTLQENAMLEVRTQVSDDIGQAIAVLDCTPEVLEVKRTVATHIDGKLGPHTLFLSASSGLPISSFTAQCSYRERSLIAHPLNPPDIVPVIELVPANYTDKIAVDGAHALFAQVGRMPVVLKKEVPGFAANRLALALFREAAKLVGDGVIDPANIELLVEHGLGLRWAAAGPFETYHLNQNGSFAGYFARIADHLDEIVPNLCKDARVDRRGLEAVSAYQDAKAAPLPSRRDRRNTAIEGFKEIKERLS